MVSGHLGQEEIVLVEEGCQAEENPYSHLNQDIDTSFFQSAVVRAESSVCRTVQEVDGSRTMMTKAFDYTNVPFIFFCKCSLKHLGKNQNSANGNAC